jgi:hypothetical protein
MGVSRGASGAALALACLARGDWGGRGASLAVLGDIHNDQ